MRGFGRNPSRLRITIPSALSKRRKGKFGRDVSNGDDHSSALLKKEEML
jgi:hypothetical protein